MKVRLALYSLLVVLLSQSSSFAALFSENFDTDPSANWTVLRGGGTDSFVDFNYDYGTLMGIPAAPNSGGTTKGMRFLCNQSAGVFQGITAFPTGQGFTGNYRLRFDMWLNYVGPLNGGGNGSTQLGTFGVGGTGASAMWASVAPAGIMFGATGDGGSTDDYRCYSNGVHLAAASGAYVASNRNSTATYYTTNFLGKTAPAAQLALYPEQTGTSDAGSVGFAWHDVVVEKIGNTVTWSIDGKLIATSGTPANFSTNVFFGMCDINGGSSTNLNDHLTASIYDNIRVESLGSAISLQATANTASEGGANGEFTFSRTGDVSSPVTVNYTIGGTAVNGTDYSTIPSSVSFGANETSKTVSISPTDDSTPELTETVILTITTSTNYGIGTAIATVSIKDNETPTLNISASQPSAYEASVGDYVQFRVTRLGLIDNDVTANLSFSGTATDSSDYSTPSTSLTVPGGSASATVNVSVIDDTTTENDETVIATITSGSYDIGATNSATATILDDELGTEDVIFADNFESDSSANWQIKFAANNGVDLDYQAAFGYNYGDDGIPTAPGAANNNGLKLTVNKLDGTAAGAAGINIYPATNTVSGDFAVRGQVYLKLGSTSTTEQGLFGINHSGNKTNWFRESTGNVTVPNVDADGLWYAIFTDASENHLLYTGTNAASAPTLLASRAPSTLTGAFKVPPHTLAGAPNNNWADFEIKQVGNVVTMSLNRTVIFQTTNSTPYTSGKIMLGYNDSYDSTGANAAAYFHNLRVVRLESTAPTSITFSRSGSSLTLNWTGSGYTLQEAASVTGPWNNVTTTSGYVANTSSGTKFYRLIK